MKNVSLFISLAAMAITGLPDLLQQMGIDLPVKLDVILGKIIFWASIATFVVSKLPVLHPEEKKLPFSTDTKKETEVPS